MGIAKFLAFPAAFAVLLACGEVGEGSEYKSDSSGSQNFLSSSSKANSSSSLSDFDIGLEWVAAPAKSQVHGTTEITLDAYDVSKNLITQSQYKVVMGVNPSKGVKNDTLPVEGITWFKAVEFCKKLSGKMGLDSNAIRLPTEAEWEYVAFPGLIQRNADYWEWTNDCYGNLFPDVPICSDQELKVRKGFAKGIDERNATDPYLEDISRNHISFRVVRKRNF
jgi:formylglycine-generating enzyme required for sulfatase activity